MSQKRINTDEIFYDGLTREQITEYVRELNTIAAECEIAGTAELSRAAHNLYRIAKQWFKSLPIRDAAAGAGPITTEQLDRLQFGRELHARPPATPNPAPDAMRDKRVMALAEKIRTADVQQLGAERYAIINLLIPEHEMEDFCTALSASVPSPDGARREVETTLQMISNAAADAALRDTSATGAAEPVSKAVERLRQYASVMDSDAYADETEPNLREDIELVCRIALATPPVRGDLEAIIRLAEIHLGMWLKSSNPALQLIPTAARQDIRDFADAILSLPVQPGEREAIIRDCIVVAGTCEAEGLITPGEMRSAIIDGLRKLVAVPVQPGDQS